MIIKEKLPLKEYIDKLILARSEILRSTHYTNALYQGNYGDSSKDSDFRMFFVKEAEKEFIRDNQKYILRKAAQLVKNELKKIIELGEDIKQVDLTTIPPVEVPLYG